MADPITIGTGLAKIAALLDKLKQKSKDREIAEIITEFQAAYFEAKEKQLQLYDENLQLNRQTAQLKESHAQEISGLKAKHLQELARLNPSQSSLTPEAANILKYFFDRPGDWSDPQIAAVFRVSGNVAAHHTDKLLEKGFITQTIVGMMGAAPRFSITPKGRDYIMQNSVAKS